MKTPKGFRRKKGKNIFINAKDFSMWNIKGALQNLKYILNHKKIEEDLDLLKLIIKDLNDAQRLFIYLESFECQYLYQMDLGTSINCLKMLEIGKFDKKTTNQLLIESMCNLKNVLQDFKIK